MNETIKVLTERRSIRKFSDKLVSEAELDLILEAGVYAPSGMGKQSAIAIAAQDPAMVARIKESCRKAKGIDSDPFYGAPTVIAVLTDPEGTLYRDDGPLMIGNMLNAAWSLGIDSIWIHQAKESFESPEGQAILEELGVPKNYVGIGHIALGYRADDVADPVPAPRKEGRIIKVL